MSGFWNEQGLLNQPVVYWAPATVASNGNETFPTPVELLVSYIDKQEEVIRKLAGTTKDTGSSSIIQTDFVIARDGYILIDGISGLTAEQLANPKKLNEAYRILRVHRAVDLDSGLSLYRGYLG